MSGSSVKIAWQSSSVPLPDIEAENCRSMPVDADHFRLKERTKSPMVSLVLVCSSNEPRSEMDPC